MEAFPRALARALGCVVGACLLFAATGCAGGRYLRIRRAGEQKGVSRSQEPPFSTFTIRVAAARDVHSFLLAGRGIRAASSNGAADLPLTARIEIKGESVRVGGSVLRLPVTLTASDGGHPIEMNGRLFEGRLTVFRDLVVNTLPLETYLEGVLASEIPAGWPEETLKAQAVVSRTFAVRKILDRRGELYDVEDSEMDQKYAFAGPNPPIDAAVMGTEGIILAYDGAPIEAFFHASSGGVTESCRNVFQKDLPYLRSVRDPYTERAAEPEWKCELSAEAIAERLTTIPVKAADAAAGLRDIRVRSRTESGRVSEFALVFGRNRECIVRGNDFRLAIDPKSFKSLLLDRVDRKTVNGTVVFSFTGKGYGHGVGMSQLGAKAMAEMGFGYREILAFYYRGVRVERWDGN
jgi:stage II sporulation protein D